MSVIANQNDTDLSQLSLAEIVARRKTLTEQQLTMQREGCPYDPALSESENALKQKLFQDKLSFLINMQLRLIAVARKTASGPAKAGGKRAKRAPIDLAALEDSVFE